MDVKEKLNKGLDYFLSEGRYELVSLYKERYGETICSLCKPILKRAYNKLLKEADKETCPYKLKRSINTETSENPDVIKGHFSNYNLTKEIAENLISNGYQSYFKL